MDLEKNTPDDSVQKEETPLSFPLVFHGRKSALFVFEEKCTIKGVDHDERTLLYKNIAEVRLSTEYLSRYHCVTLRFTVPDAVGSQYFDIFYIEQLKAVKDFIEAKITGENPDIYREKLFALWKETEEERKHYELKEKEQEEQEKQEAKRKEEEAKNKKLGRIWYYYDENNVKQGPVNTAELTELAKNKTITRDTIIENLDNKRGTLIDTSWLSFNESVKLGEAHRSLLTEKEKKRENIMGGLGCLVLVVLFIICGIIGGNLPDTTEQDRKAQIFAETVVKSQSGYDKLKTDKERREYLKETLRKAAREVSK